MAIHELLKVSNYGDQDFRDTYDNDAYRVPAGGQAFVPKDAIITWFGDPNLTDGNPDKPTRMRTLELTRIRGRLGVYDNEESGLDPHGKPMVGFKNRMEGLKLSFRNAEDTEDFVPLIWDPDGTLTTPATISVAQADLLNQRQAQLEAELRALRAQQETQQFTHAPSDMPPEERSPDDLPDNPLGDGTLIPPQPAPKKPRG